MLNTDPDTSFAIVTPTYLPDLARCKILAESLDICSPNVSHYIIVDHRDWVHFKHLEGPKRHLIESESLLGPWIRRMPGRKSVWLSLKSLPVRGWIIQQILKLASIEAIAERTLVFCDSDTAFFRHFDRASLLVNEKIGLLDVEPSADSIRWTKTARRLLQIEDLDGGYRNHVGNMICWNRETIKEVQDRIEFANGMNWQIALARTPSFSEYVIYGVFVRELKGYAGVDHAPSTVPLVKPSWGLDLTADAALAKFFSDFDPCTVAVMIHSKDGVAPSQYRPYLERQWRSLRSASPHHVS